MEYQHNLQKYGGLSGITVFFDHYDGKNNTDNIVSYITQLKALIYKGYLEGNNPNFSVNLMLNIVWDYDSKDFCVIKSSNRQPQKYFSALSELLLASRMKQPLQTNVEDLVAETVSDFENRLQKTNLLPAAPYVDKLLVFINEPTGRSKKCLRLQVENEFFGDQRIDVLRMIIPIINRAQMPESGDKADMFLQNDLS